MNHSTSTLTLETLHQMSDGLAEDFKQQIEAAVMDDVLICPVTTRKTPAREIEPIRARRTTRNQLQFDFWDDEE